MINHPISAILLLALALTCGCLDATRADREKLALCILNSSAPLDLDFDSIPPEMQRMHVGAAQSKRTADLLDDFLKGSPQLDSETLALVAIYAKNQRTCQEQFAAAVTAGRTDLTPEEQEITAECSRQELFLIDEICTRIDFGSLVTESQ